MLFEAPDVAAPEVAAAMSDFVLDAQFVPGVRAVMSPLSLRVTGPAGGGAAVSLPAAARETMAARLAAAGGHARRYPRRCAADRTALLVILPITEPATADMDGRRAQLDALAALADRVTATSAAEVRLSGYPVLRDNVARALVRDIVVLNGIGCWWACSSLSSRCESLRLALLTLPGPDGGVHASDCMATSG